MTMLNSISTTAEAEAVLFSSTRHVLHRDFETRSRVILKSVGAHKYAIDPSTEVLCGAFAVDDEPVRLKSFATAVLDGLRCASSCAFAWLGGSPRFMEGGAQIGFHAAYIERSGRASESGVGNALVGSYLTQIGLSENAVVYITQAAPSQMTWLTLPDAKQIGIEVLPLDQQTPATKPMPRVTSREPSNQDMRSRARLFVKEMYAR